MPFGDFANSFLSGYTERLNPGAAQDRRLSERLDAAEQRQDARLAHQDQFAADRRAYDAGQVRDSLFAAGVPGFEGGQPAAPQQRPGYLPEPTPAGPYGRTADPYGAPGGQLPQSEPVSAAPADDPWKKTQVQELERSVDLVQQRQDLNPVQKQYALAHLGQQMRAIDPNGAYRRGSPQSRVTAIDKFATENLKVFPEHGFAVAVDAKGQPHFHALPKPEKAEKALTYLEAFKALQTKDVNGNLVHPSHQDVIDLMANAEEAHNPEAAMNPEIHAAREERLARQQAATQPVMDRHAEELRQKQEESAAKHRELLSKEYDNAHKLLFGHEDTPAFLGARTSADSRSQAVESYLKRKLGFINPAPPPAPRPVPTFEQVTGRMPQPAEGPTLTHPRGFLTPQQVQGLANRTAPSIDAAKKASAAIGAPPPKPKRPIYSPTDKTLGEFFQSGGVP